LDPKGKGFPEKSEDEIRYAILAQYAGKLWMGFSTLRGSKIRIISVRSARKGEKSYMKAKDLDGIFDDGDIDFTKHLDLSQAFKPGQEQKRVNVDFPVWMLERIEKEAEKLGVPRQSLIKVWIGEKLEKKTPKEVAKKRSLQRPSKKRVKGMGIKG